MSKYVKVYDYNYPDDFTILGRNINPIVPIFAQ